MACAMWHCWVMQETHSDSWTQQENMGGMSVKDMKDEMEMEKCSCRKWANSETRRKLKKQNDT